MALVEDIKSGFKADLVSQVAKSLSGGILVIVLARLLSPEEYGLVYLSLSIFTFVTLLGKLGLGKSAARYITEYEENGPGQIPHIIETAAVSLFITLSIATVGLVLLSGQIAAIMGDPELQALLLVGAVFVATSGFLDSSRKICQGFKKIEWAAYIKLVDSILRPILAIGLVLAGFGAVGAITGYVVGSLSAALFGMGFSYYLYSGSIREEIEPDLRRRVAEYAAPIALTHNSDTLLKRVDIILVGAFLTPLAVSHYVVAKQLMTFLKTPANSLGFAVTPRYSEQIHRGNLDVASRLYNKALTSILTFYLPAAVGLILVAEPTLELVFGPEYAGGAIVLQILTLYLVVQTISYVTGGGLDYLGKAKYRAYAKGSAAIINLILNIILIPSIGIVGAAVSTAGSYTIYVALNVYLLHLELDLDWLEIGFNFAKISIVTAVMAISIFPFVASINSLVSLLTVVGFGGLVWLVATVSVGLIERQQLRAAIPV
ncbi:flippase [Natronococcus sp. A-GB7]|uniref:flippase n=1 Tax=Natronococcus sp. A-GB7 TaxID=3037649 RepID=UPI002420214D|nr:flippase [Natronococcus sp. A-GB7]MDG5821291.1 flippase [Natronococcus sp. A-GB7]